MTPTLKTKFTPESYLLSELRALMPAEWSERDLVWCVLQLRLDRQRLDWLLADMGRKGFDDKACGVVAREDIDAALVEEAK